MKKYLLQLLRLSLMLMLAVTVFSACSSSSDSDDDEDELEPVGFVIKNQAGDIIIRQFIGSLTGSLTISAGAEATYTVRFLSEDDEEFIPVPDEHDITFTVLSGNGNIVITTNDELSTKFNFNLSGASEGVSSVRLILLHEGATEFTSVPFDVTVNPNN